MELDESCNKETSGEGKYGYKYEKSLACCDADGLTFTKKTKPSKIKTPDGKEATCCIAATAEYKEIYKGKLPCCNNRFDRSGFTCQDRAASNPSFTLKRSPMNDMCKDPSRKFHFITTSTMWNKGRADRTASGDTCCSSDKIHMEYQKSCCSTTYTPCLKTKGRSKVETLSAPPCCGTTSKVDLCRETYPGNLGNDLGPAVYGKGFLFCADNESGAWNITSNLPPLGVPEYKDGKAQCYNGTRRRLINRYGIVSATLAESCCDTHVDRFDDRRFNETCRIVYKACLQGVLCLSNATCYPPS